MTISCQVDLHTDADAANDPTLITIHCVGLGILGPFPRAIGGYQYLYITINKFTKWLEVTPMVKINKQSSFKFIKSIVYQFGIPNRIITDNRSQFTSGAF
jgi:hypothetical protein